MSAETVLLPDEAAAKAYLAAAEVEAAHVPGLEGLAPRPLDRVAIIGGGTMGVGIAVSVAESGLDVVVVERDAASAQAARERVGSVYARHLKRAALSDDDKAARIARVVVTDDWETLRGCTLAVEAAFEDMAVKRDIFARLDALLPPAAILATNTSYLDIDALAATVSRPADVLGLHFFAPANLMKLLEIVRAARTAPDALATALVLAARLKKQPVVAGVCDGFIGNRIYATYRRHVEYLLEDGAMPEDVDVAL
ncbi:MAG: 3-hydroxyacyl-CoA dehydrogenase family protein, partial [Acidobacteria bacterium]|nr:3-hydroxyacyl-CoA dehydrogenase family protein [Acidobacteriota bacterium]